MDIKVQTVNNKWKLFSLLNDKGMEVQFLNYGGIITKILVPDKNSNIANIVLGYSDYKDYESDQNFFGAIIGPVAGRIEGAKFSLNEEKFNLEKNDGNHHLHGGTDSFHHIVWKTESFKKDHSVGVTLSYLRKDGENVYPGNLDVSVTYTLTNNNQFIIDYWATTDKKTPVTLTNHSYFNLSGNLDSTIHNHRLIIDSCKFLELDKELIPTGEIKDAINTNFDFRKGKKISDGITSQTGQNRIVGNGYDHYVIFDHDKKENVVVREEISGRILKIKTNQPGMVLYTGQNLVEGLELSGGTSKKYSGVCFETQSSAASLHHRELPSIILEAGETYEKQTLFSFDVE
ncbi:aldose epimerase family protein [Carnobacterium sp. ISL-102]|uniref:aldose epimerase family protein n=1 Tax=Carnobacterium sp. ISL-102 TaxID=2819142 RepID=UPI001BED162E|nr:aldose epimerase family protein [Carnobacterium sp. ISL-102]MBT2732455.1 galactose mutarotase [Carnobacterium sp. ISL-102]